MIAPEPHIAPTSPQIMRLATLARRYAEQGRMESAEKICLQILELEPTQPLAVSLIAARALERGDHKRAADLRQRLTESQPDEPSNWRMLAAVQRQAGDLDAARRSLLGGLRACPDTALLYADLALVLQQLGEAEQAALSFTRAFLLDDSLANARRIPSQPMERRRLSQAGDDLLNAFHYATNAALAESIAGEMGSELPERWYQFLRGFHRQEAIVHENPLQRPDYQYYQGLTAQPFWPRERFPWLDQVEAACETIRSEFLAAMAAREGFEPYVHAVDSAPAAWKAMSGKLDWASLHLVRGNRPVVDNCKRCPATAALFAELPLARAEGHAPEVFFSVLEPGTHIPPHYGVANTKLAIHLPLIIPDDCAIRVGEETRGWSEGQCLIFDDSFLHEAWNRSDRTRVVLIFETWHPELSELETRCLTAIIERAEAWLEHARSLALAELEAS